MTYEDLLEKNCNSLEELIEFVDTMLSLYYEIDEFEGITTVDVYCLDDNMSSDLIVSYEFKEGKPINRI